MDMHNIFKRLPLGIGCFFLFCIFSQSVQAAIGEGLQLTAEDPLTISAESLSYFITENLYVAEGSVEITYRTARLQADRVEFYELTGDALALGNVLYQEGTETMTADHAEFNFDRDRGMIYSGDLALTDDHYITGREIEKIGEKTYLIRNGSYTACNSPRPAWKFKSWKAKVEEEQYLQSWHTVGFMKGIPIIYFPYFFFPIKTERQTGFLVPDIGNSSSNGFSIGTNFFWAITKSQDATFGHTYYDKRGHKFDVEYRYIYSEDTDGTFIGQFIKDQSDLTQKKRLEWYHQQGLPYSIKGRVEIDWASDDRFDEDFSTNLDERSKSQLGSSVSLTRNFSQHSIMLLFNREDDLREGNENRADQRFPELSISSQKQQIFGTPLYIQQSTKISYLKREGKKNEELEFGRVDFQPTLSLPWNVFGQALTITPEFELRETYYTRDAETAANQDLDAKSTHRTYYSTSLEVSGPKFNRIFDFGVEHRFQKLKHLIEPSLSFTYKPGINEDEYPKFDGIDRIGSKKRSRNVSYGITQRLLMKQVTQNDWERFKKGEEELYIDELTTETKELASFSVSQSYDFEKEEENFSAITTSLNVNPFDNYRLTVGATYNIYVDSFTQTNVTFTGKLWEKVDFNVNWRRNASLKRENDELKIERIYRYLDISTSVNLSDRLGLSYRGRYNLEEHERIEDNLGLTYNAQCWNVTGSYVEQLVSNEIDRGFHILLELKHLGKLFDIEG